MSQSIRGQGGHLVFSIGPKNTNLVEDVEILLPVKFRWILFSGFRREVENISANQRPGRPSCFSDWPKNHKLCRGRWDLATCQVLLNSVQWFRRRSRKCLSQSEARAAILFFRSAQKHKLCRGHWDLASCQVSLNYVLIRQAQTNIKYLQTKTQHSYTRNASCHAEQPSIYSEYKCTCAWDREIKSS